jgi:hypothetical protein
MKYGPEVSFVGAKVFDIENSFCWQYGILDIKYFCSNKRYFWSIFHKLQSNTKFSIIPWEYFSTFSHRNNLKISVPIIHIFLNP